MTRIPLYKYIRLDGGVTVSPVKPDGEYTELVRLVADDGMMLTDGIKNIDCVDTDKPDAWREIAVESDEATEADYQAALREMGVNV